MLHTGVLLDAPLSTNDLIERLNTNILPKIRSQLNDLSKSGDNNDATEALKKQLQVKAFHIISVKARGSTSALRDMQPKECDSQMLLLMLPTHLAIDV